MFGNNYWTIVGTLVALAVAVSGGVSYFLTNRPPRKHAAIVVSITSVVIAVVVLLSGQLPLQLSFPHTNNSSASPTSSTATLVTLTSSPTSTPTVTQVTPTPQLASLPPDQLYKIVTGNKPTWADSLNGQDANNWNTSLECAFTGGAYQVSAVQPGQAQECFATNIPSLNDFAFQVQMTVLTGTSGGLVFRSTSPTQNSTNYQVGLDIDGYYDFHLGHFQKCNHEPSNSHPNHSDDHAFCQSPTSHQGLCWRMKATVQSEARAPARGCPYHTRTRLSSHRIW